jgi:hypothetical protein
MIAVSKKVACCRMSFNWPVHVKLACNTTRNYRTTRQTWSTLFEFDFEVVMGAGGAQLFGRRIGTNRNAEAQGRQ